MNGSSGNDSWDGQYATWTPGTTNGPKLSIKNATKTVNTKGTIHIANGQYTSENNTKITIDKNMNIIGESQSGTIINGTDTNWIFQISSGVNATITNLTITNAKTTGNGSAIYNNGNLTVTNCTFTNNTVTYITYHYCGRGGAIYNVGNMSLSNCTFTNNTATFGGAIYNEGTLTVSNCTFTNNKAHDGGAICNSALFNDVNSTIMNCTFTGNIATYSGGAISNGGTLNVTDCTFTGNNATDYGGAIFNYGNLTVSGSTFIDNTVQWYGGAITNGGNLTVSDSKFKNNTARNNYDVSVGGAIYNYSSLIISGSTFIGNSASYGGAIDNEGTGLTISDSTFTGNTAQHEGGAIRNYNDSFKVTNSTFTGNTAQTGGAIWNYGSDANSRIIKFNRIVGNNPSNSEIYSEYGTVDATLNWWGSNSSPAGKISIGTEGTVLFDPWIVLTITANPITIHNSGTSQLTGDLLHDSTGSYHDSALGHVPDIPITLAIPWGSFTSSGITHTITLNTTNGVVNAVFYAKEGAVNASYNPVKITALADSYTTNDTESAYITINKTAKLYLKTKSSNNNPTVSEKFLLTYKLGNYGPDAADNVTITFQLPEGLDLVNIKVDSGNFIYNETTRTVTWTLDSVPVGDPYLYLTVKAAGDGTYNIIPNITSTTYNLNSGDDGNITISVGSNNNNSSNGNSNNENTVKAASKTTIGLQDTGLPLNYLILAVLMVLSGLVPKRK